MTDFAIERIASKVQYFTEPLEGLGEVIPLDMVAVPGGDFVMGSPSDEVERDYAEDPQHTVTVPNLFMGRYPITQAQWHFVAGLDPVNHNLRIDPSKFKGSNRPVEQVSWNEAVEFCKRLAKHTARPYRLPNEAEWEYACRARTTTPFAFGKILTPELCNYDSRQRYDGSATYDGRMTYGREFREETTPVDEFGIANAFGLCDMHGNVWEWCADHWHDDYEGAPTEASVWLTDDKTSNRVVRGGSWIDSSSVCRSATRSLYPPDEYSDITGFRVMCPAVGTMRQRLFSLQPINPFALGFFAILSMQFLNFVFQYSVS